MEDDQLPQGHEGGTGDATTVTKAEEIQSAGFDTEGHGGTKDARDTDMKKKTKSKKRRQTMSLERSKTSDTKKDKDRDGPGGLHRFLVPK